MSINSRNKGKVGERELAERLVEIGLCESAERSARCGVTGAADVWGIPGVHHECKRVEKLNVEKAMDQAKGDARNGDIPAVFHRRNRGEWMVTVRMSDLAVMSARVMASVNGACQKPQGIPQSAPPA